VGVGAGQYAASSLLAPECFCRCSSVAWWRSLSPAGRSHRVASGPSNGEWLERQFAAAQMSSARPGRLSGMTGSTQTPTTLNNIGVAMFTVADQDAALAFYTEKLGFEVRGDTRFGENGEYRWLEVAPPGSRARLALNPPMGGQPGGGGIGVETPDVLAEHRRLRALGVDVDPEPVRTPGAPLLFMMRDPDGNHIAVVEAPPAE